MSRLSIEVTDTLCDGRTSYLSRTVDEEFINVEILRRPDRRTHEFAIALRPPRPSSSFEVSDTTIESSSANVMHEIVLHQVGKHASELRWNCIETMLRADIESQQLDRMRMVEFLEKTLDNETREWLATKLMERVERVPR